MNNIVRRTMVLTVINIFLLLAVTVLSEYLNLTERMAQMERTIKAATDQALDASVTAEELFSTGNGATDIQSVMQEGNVNILVWANGEFYGVNQYYLTKYLNDEGKKVYNLTSSDISTINDRVSNNSYNMTGVFEYLYGNAGTCNIAGATNATRLQTYAWAVPKSRRSAYAKMSEVFSTDRTPTTNYGSYYKNIGQYLTTQTYIKHYLGSDKGADFELVEKEVPILYQVGLNMYGYSDTTYKYLYTANNLMANYALEKGVSSVKVTSLTDLATGSTKTKYYFLTPYSLGVTYVPTEVFVPLVTNNINTIARMTRISASGDSADFELCDGCLDTNVFGTSGWTTDGAGEQQTHKSASTEYIVNDGSIEYDLASVQGKVEYFLVDYGSAKTNTSVAEVLAKIEGSISAYEYSSSSPRKKYATLDSVLTENAKQFLEGDTAQGYYESRGVSDFANTKRIIARVSVRMKCHICYESPILQWACMLSDPDKASQHYDIKLWSPDDNEMDTDSNGVWYQYTTYIGQTR